MVFPRVALVRVHQTFGGCWYPSHIRHNETTAFTKNPPPFRDRGSVLAGFWPAPVFRRQRCGILTWSSACCASLPSTGTEPRTSVATCLTAAVAAHRLARRGRRADRRPDRRARPAGTRRLQSRHAVGAGAGGAQSRRVVVGAHNLRWHRLSARWPTGLARHSKPNRPAEVAPAVESDAQM